MTRMVLVFLGLLWFSSSFAASGIRWKEVKIPMKEAAPQGLEALLVWPDDGSKHPVAIISHGSPRDPKDRNNMTALSYLSIAEEFARRGFSTAVVLRRGYGGSGGGWVEGYGSCASPNYENSAIMSAQDLQAAIRYLNGVPQFDTQQIIAVGVSAGGFATVALTAINPPPGLLAAISFAGGRGSTAEDTVCHPEALIAAFAKLGKTSRTPMLWVYSKNDHFFNTKLAKQFYIAFTSSGGQATFIEAQPYGQDGHFLFSNMGIPQWTPLVDQFLKSQNLILVHSLLPLPGSPDLIAPAYLTKKAKLAFASYINAAPHKAFAVSSDGSYGWRTGQRTVALAEEGARDYCEQYASEGCKIIAVDGEMVQ